LILENDMATHLVVVAPFGDRAMGEWITDPDEIKRVAAENAESVVRVAAEANPNVRPEEA
jgi:hypothetical protein